MSSVPEDPIYSIAKDYDFTDRGYCYNFSYGTSDKRIEGDLYKDGRLSVHICGTRDEWEESGGGREMFLALMRRISQEETTRVKNVVSIESAFPDPDSDVANLFGMGEFFHCQYHVNRTEKGMNKEDALKATLFGQVAADELGFTEVTMDSKNQVRFRRPS